MSKWSSITCLLRPVTKMKCSIPASRASSTTTWSTGWSTSVSISFGIDFVAGSTRVPKPATGKTALRIRRCFDGADMERSTSGQHFKLGDNGRMLCPFPS